MPGYYPDYSSRDAYYARKDGAVAAGPADTKQAGGEPKAHDFRRGGWGHEAMINDIIDDGHKVRMHGWGSGICVGDFIIKSNNENGAKFASYRVDSIRYERDPPDMFWAECTWTPGVFAVVVETDKIVRI